MRAYHSKIVGSTFCNGQEIIKKLAHGDELKLKREPENQYDKNAVAIYVGLDRIGYIPKDTAISLSIIMDRGDEKIQAFVEEVTGGGTKNVGCNILIKIDDN